MIELNPIVFSGGTFSPITFLASFLVWLMFGALLVLWVIDGKFKKEQVLHAILAMIVALTISGIFKILIPSIRPFESNGKPPLTITIPRDSAFPSNHTAIAFSMAVSIWLHKKRFGLAFLVGAFLVGLGRILANVHFSLDVLGGALIGVLSAYLVYKIHLHSLVK